MPAEPSTEAPKRKRTRTGQSRPDLPAETNPWLTLLVPRPPPGCLVCRRREHLVAPRSLASSYEADARAPPRRPQASTSATWSATRRPTAPSRAAAASRAARRACGPSRSHSRPASHRTRRPLLLLPPRRRRRPARRPRTTSHPSPRRWLLPLRRSCSSRCRRRRSCQRCRTTTGSRASSRTPRLCQATASISPTPTPRRPCPRCRPSRGPLHSKRLPRGSIQARRSTWRAGRPGWPLSRRSRARPRRLRRAGRRPGRR